MTRSSRLLAPDGALLVIDFQTKLVDAMPSGALAVANGARLITVAKLLGVPVAATEQYPQGLGPTVEPIAQLLPEPPTAKITFHAASGPLVAEWRASGIAHVTLTGAETHVCVLQTALELLEAGFAVQVPADAVVSRATFDWHFALRRLECAGAVVTSTEAVLFGWLGTADHPHFKTISRLVRDFHRAVPDQPIPETKAP